MRGILLGLVGCLLAAGCGGRSQAAPAAPPTTRFVIRDRAGPIYDSLASLARDAVGVAVVRVPPRTSTVPADEAGTGVITTMTTEVDVVEVLLGRLPHRLTLRHDLELHAGSSYVLFLQRFEYHRGRPTGQWIVPADVGVYVETPTGYDLVSETPDRLPARLASLADLRRRITA